MSETAPESVLPGLSYEPDDVYVLEELDQVRAAATPLRVQILDCLRLQAMTVRAIGQELGISSTKLYYHVNELERVGLVVLVHTDIQGGIQQKYYRARAQYYFLSSDLLRGFRTKEDISVSAAFMTSQLDAAAQSLRNAYLEGAIEDSLETFFLSRREIRASQEHAKTLHERMKEFDQLAVEYDDPNGECELELVMSVFPRKKEQALPE